jgi:hypothetical protein
VALALAAAAVIGIPVMAAGWRESFRFGRRLKGRRGFTAQDGQTACGVGFLHALLLGLFLGLCGRFVAAHAGDGRGVVGVP